ncbi:hypothetical protein EVAR_61616_1 [Eumeta japonica]|uniref:RNase H type-1 domain-containing protein n=1 Tax=Eumeta variegata TaxID=151549 RepID=A0A4C1ZL00_EUMVA|nr:hypothetical protein EVAR_61616_1 [Eumeta japonica]
MGAAFMEYRVGDETSYSTLRLDPFCSVFQGEMVAMQRAIRRVKKDKDWLVNVFTDSRSALGDELARRASLTKEMAAGYINFPLSYANKVINAASFKERQERYAE